jgi:hypothetical protein
MVGIMDASNDNFDGFEPVRMKLDGTGGNAFSLLGAFAAHARQQGWSEDGIAAVQQRAMAGDYDHLIRTIRKHICDA